MNEPRGDRSSAIIVFTRYPEPGVTKTRLIGLLGKNGAADLQREMTQHVFTRARLAADRCGAMLEVRYEGGDRERMRQWLGARARYVRQGEGDLGQRLQQSFQHALDEGADRVVVIGADCPDIEPGLLADALAALSTHDLVLGPAHDGGYYLIGLRTPCPALFTGMDWGTDSVLTSTIAAAERQRLSCRLLRPLSDVDRPEDLPVWQRASAPRAETLSVVIPALNEQHHIARTIESAADAWDREIIVADGGSSDDTVGEARRHGARVLNTPRGRARQMNAGAEAAQGEYLLFLHADTILPPGYDAIVRNVLSEKETIAGAFRLRIDAPGRALRWVEAGTNWRARRRRMPYGDQALFLRREAFQALGAFPDIPLMEDYALVRRARRRGRVALAPAAVKTSGRRWLKHGVLRTTLLNQCIILAYRLGVSPERLFHSRG